MAAEDYIEFYPGWYDDPPSGTIYYLDEWEIVRETPKARLVRDHAGNEEWIPKSQGGMEPPPFMGMTDKDEIFAVEKWIAEEKPLAWREYRWDG